MDRVQVLMSTYNGEKHLTEQIVSLKNQTSVQMKLLIRDDGSSGETQKVLLSLKDNSLSITLGSNVGIIDSFLDLLKKASEDTDYYSFCDQDDVWKPNKLNRALSHLKTIPPNIPTMYCSRTELVDENLNHLGYWPPRPRKDALFANAIIENIAVGCTVVINSAARKLILSRVPDSSKVIMHDWWIYLCISAFGRVIYDDEPTIMYRQHDSNSIGGTTSFVQKWSRKLMNFSRNRKRQLLRKQAQEFYRLYGEDLSKDKRTLIEKFLNSNSSLYKRISYCWKPGLYRHSIIDNSLFRIMYLLNVI